MDQFFKTLFPSSSTAPRWVIFTVDVAICAISFVFATLLRFNFFYNDPFLIELFYPLPLVLAVRIGFMVYFRLYAGIIRYTSLQDAVRLFYTLSFSSILLGFINVFYVRVSPSHISFIPISIIIIDYFGSLVLMSAFRMTAKILFIQASKPDKSIVIHYAVFGAGEAGFVAKQKLEQHGRIKGEKRVVAFFDDDPRKVNNYLDGITIYNFENEFENVVRKFNITELIISPQQLPTSRRQNIIEKCLEFDVSIRNVPPAERWINGELSFNQLKQVRIEDLIEREAIVLDKGAIAQQLFHKTVLITGAAGSIGSELANQIVKNFNPLKIILLDKSEIRLYELDLELSTNYKVNFKSKIELVIGDITNEARMRMIFEKYAPNIVYHAAAYKHVPLMEANPSEAIWVNVAGTKMMANLSIEYGVEKFVMISTDKAVNPTNVMGASKRIAEIYVQSLNTHLTEATHGAHHTRFITTRFGNVLGSSGSVIPKFRKQIEEGGPITVTHPDITRYFMTIPEACQLVLEAGNMGNGGEIYIFDMGESVRIYDLARKMLKLSGLKIGKDIQIIFTGLRPGEKLKEELLADQESTLPTYHPKIMIAKVRTYDFDWSQSQIEMLITLYKEQNSEFIVSKMKEIVPEFISQNSVFEELDYKPKLFTSDISKHSFLP
ncbi:MAG: nucleoside-diphosphate sugar epimerase/dehydratase [Bacteroidota bacterium]